MSAAQKHAPLASLAARWQACQGDVPPALVGASVTLVHDDRDSAKARLYLFGGRLVTTRCMVNDMYELNLYTLRWTKLISDQDASSSSKPRPQPQPRYFHSCNVWNGKLIIFGGMGYVRGGGESDLCVINETVAFDIATHTWDLDFMPGIARIERAGPEDEEEDDGEMVRMLPQSRYAHLSSTTADSLVIIGGQDMGNHYVEEINVLDLRTRRWTAKQPFAKQRGSYRSLAVEPLWHVEHSDMSSSQSAPTAKTLHSALANKRGRSGSLASSSTKQSVSSMLAPESLSFLPASTQQYDDHGRQRPLPIYVYTNYNFTDVKREMESMQLEVDDETGQCTLSVEDRSAAMSGISLPPGLRFPTGAVLGSHLIISGTYLANTSQTFAIWALHLPSMHWTRLDVGASLLTGSWNRGLLWPTQNRLIVFGNRDRDLVADYNHRQTNWDHILLIELDAWGIAQPPIARYSRASVELGMQKLASSAVGSFSATLENGNGFDSSVMLALGGRGDFEIICTDGMKLGCDRAILERRWPWFATQMRGYKARVLRTAKMLETQKGLAGASGVGLSSLLEEPESDSEGSAGTASIDDDNQAKRLTLSLKSVDPRITPRQLRIAEPSPVMLAILIFLYTRCICTPLQRHPAIVSALLVAARVYEMDDLADWAQHAAHIALATTLSTPHGANSVQGNSTAKTRASIAQSFPPLERHRLAVAVYEAATIGGYEALQIRALRCVMALAKWVQRVNLASTRASNIGESEEDMMSSVTEDQESVLAHSDGNGKMVTNAALQRGRSTSSLTGSRRSSLSLADSPGVHQFGLRPPKGDRLLDIRDTEEASNLSGQSLVQAPLPTRSASQSSGAVPASLHSAQFSQRRPSAPNVQLGGSQSSYGPSSMGVATPSTAMSQMNPRSIAGPPSITIGSTNRKRFSIFGRSNDTHKSPVTSNAPAFDTFDENGTDSDRQSLETMQQLQRTQTDGSTGTDSASGRTRSVSSLQSPFGSSSHVFPGSSSAGVGPANGGHGGGSMPAPVTSSKDARGQERDAASASSSNAGMSAGRKMTSTLGRLKSSATRSSSVSSASSPMPASQAASGGPAMQPFSPAVEQPLPSPTVGSTQTKFSTPRTSTTSGRPSVLTSTPSSSVGTSSVAGVGIHREDGQSSKRSPRDASGQMGSSTLSEKDLKALQSVWA